MGTEPGPQGQGRGAPDRHRVSGAALGDRTRSDRHHVGCLRDLRQDPNELVHRAQADPFGDGPWSSAGRLGGQLLWHRPGTLPPRHGPGAATQQNESVPRPPPCDTHVTGASCVSPETGILSCPEPPKLPWGRDGGRTGALPSLCGVPAPMCSKYPKQGQRSKGEACPPHTQKLSGSSAPAPPACSQHSEPGDPVTNGDSAPGGQALRGVRSLND